MIRPLFHAVPNPAQGAVRLVFSDAAPGGKAVTVFNALGRRVFQDQLSEPRGVFHWDGVDACGRSVAAGIYYIRLEAGAEVQTEKIHLLR